MYGSRFPDPVSPKVSCAIGPSASLTDSILQVLMQTYIPRIDLTTAQSQDVRGLKVVKGSSGKTR